jgi:hypothetical protein
VIGWDAADGDTLFSDMRTCGMQSHSVFIIFKEDSRTAELRVLGERERERERERESSLQIIRKSKKDDLPH